METCGARIFQPARELTNQAIRVATSSQIDFPPRCLPQIDCAGMSGALSSSCRYDFYQTTADVVVNIYARNQPEKDVKVQLERDAVMLISSPCFSEPLVIPLWGHVTPNFTVRVLAPKIEIVLKKKEPSVTWVALTRDATQSPASSSAVASQAASAEADSSLSARPSSKWDTLDLSDADDAPPAGSGDAELNAFFQKLYADADPDTRRAMIKSFQESGGTALSTNWEDVSKQTMEVRAPDGMVARKFEQ